MDERGIKESFQIYKYEMPQVWSERDKQRGKQNLHMGSCGGLNVGVQVCLKGGETNLHAHPGSESSWFVLGGRVKFYGAENILVAELGKGEGIFVPAGVPYWFESASEEPLEILHITSRVPGGKRGRVNFEPLLKQQDHRAHEQRGSRDATPEELAAGRVLGPQ
ncbi:MAG TPA: cupin domain-containing protein [Candidatus Acidoferrales bacterium]|nr:cupin domain-containing protein [Candidatus Acidoferrales bacterium]